MVKSGSVWCISAHDGAARVEAVGKSEPVCHVRNVADVIEHVPAYDNFRIKRDKCQSGDVYVF